MGCIKVNALSSISTQSTPDGCVRDANYDYITLLIMADTDYLTKDALFAQIPQDSDATIEHFYDPEYTTSASNQQLIDCTYDVLKNGQLTMEETLKVWELRLTLTLFNDQLHLAKREAIALNNALYMRENPNAQPPPPSRIHSNSSLSDTSSQTRAPPLTFVFPLPKNNNGLIGYRLLLMILRLKSVPNLILVNELYKMCYQMRLKGASSEAVKVQAKLTNLSYEVIMVLTITRNYFTLLSFLASLRHDIGIKSEFEGRASHDKMFYSNVCLLQVLTTLMVWSKEKSKEEFDQLPQDVVDIFTLVEDTSLVLLKHVLLCVPPVVGGADLHDNLETGAMPTLAEIADLVWNKKILARTICCTLATWELSNVFRTELVEEEGQLRLVVEVVPLLDSKLEQVYAIIMPRWGKYINKVYGIE